MVVINFADRTRFPGFTSLPLSQPSPSTASGSHSSHYLIGQVKENMTITSPTLIITDLTGNDCAVTFASSKFSVSSFRKGKTCLVVPGAERTAPVAEGKKGYVRVEEGMEGSVKCLPGKMELLGALSQRVEGKCWECEEQGGLKCLGCGLASYCGKDCQVKGWKGGHNAQCKMFKVVNEIWGEDGV